MQSSLTHTHVFFGSFAFPLWYRSPHHRSFASVVCSGAEAYRMLAKFNVTDHVGYRIRCSTLQIPSLYSSSQFVPIFSNRQAQSIASYALLARDDPLKSAQRTPFVCVSALESIRGNFRFFSLSSVEMITLGHHPCAKGMPLFQSARIYKYFARIKNLKSASNVFRIMV